MQPENADLNDGGFYTLKGYSMRGGSPVTYAMEDYLEIMYRLYDAGEDIRIKKLSEILHVRPSSASKMAVLLKSEELVDFQRYGRITLSEKGKALGEYLLFRHNVLNGFLCCVNGSSDELSTVEKIEHYIDEKTVKNINDWLHKNYSG